MSTFLDQPFGDDEESDNDFQPGVERGSDDEGNDKRPLQSKSRAHSDDEQRSPRRSAPRDLNGDSSPPSKPKARRSEEAGEVNGDDAEELDGDTGEDDEGEGEEPGQDEDDEEDEDEDEDEGPRSRPKKRRRALNQFFEEEAEVDEDDDDLEGEDEGLGNEFIDETHPDDDLPAEGDQDDRHHRELDRRRQEEASMDAEKRAQELKEKYGRRTQTSLTSSSFVPQNLLMHDVSKDPTLFNIRCKDGKEKDIIQRIMKKCEEAYNNRKELLILSAFERGEGAMKGCIFIEAESKAKAEEFLKGISDVYPHSKMQIVPSNEMPDCLRVTKSKTLTPGSYVRIRKGLYTNDLAIVEEVQPNTVDVGVKLIPRLTYGLDEDDSRPNAQSDNKRKRPGFGNTINLANRPAARLFNENEAKKKHARHLQTLRGLTSKEFSYKGETYVDGFLIKTFKLAQLSTENVQPKLEETQMFAKAGQDGSETLDLETLKHSLHDNASAEASYQVGDDVEVWRGEQRGLFGKTERVTQGILTMKVVEGELAGEIVETPIKDIRKRFREGDNVIMGPGSKYAGQTGMISSIDGDKATVITQDSNNEITTFIKDLAKASGVSGSTERSKFDVRDLVQLTATTFGCVVSVDAQSIRVMNQSGTIESRLPSSISTIETSRNVVAVDKNGSEIRLGDSVKEAGGEGKTGSIMHIYRNFLFAHDRTRMTENAGIWVARCSNVVGHSSRGGAPLADLTKMNPALRQPGADPSMGPPQKPGLDRLLRKHVKITRGNYKGNRGVVKDTTVGEARVELESKSKVVNVSKIFLNVLDDRSEVGTPYADWVKLRGPPAMATGGYSSRVPDGAYGSRTPAPMDGGRTPAWNSSSRTPAWGGPSSNIDSSRTPAWSGASGGRTTYGGSGGGATSYGGAGNFGGGRTPAWSSNSRTPYGDHGFGSSNTSSGSSAFDAFASGSRTPAYTSSSSRTPAWSGPAASAPTPAARPYDAPTPAATAPTPGRYDDDAYTPAFSAPTPGASGSYGSTNNNYSSNYNSSSGYNNSNAVDAPTPRFAKAANTEPIKNNRFAQLLDAPTPAANAPTPYATGGAMDAPTPAAGGPRYAEDDDDD